MIRAQSLARSFVALGAPRAGRAEPGLKLVASCLHLLAVLILLLFLAVDLSVDAWFPGVDADADDPPMLASDAAVPGLTLPTLAMGAAGDRKRLRSSAPSNPAHRLRAPPRRPVLRVSSVGASI